MGFQSMFEGISPTIVPHVTSIKTNSVSPKKNHMSAITHASFQFGNITFHYMKIGRKGYFAVASFKNIVLWNF